MVPVTLRYTNPGAQPPIFLAGSFSEPAWDPIEMEYTTAEDGEYQFTKEVMVKEGGQFQYKFRIGSGDWWVLNEDAPTVTDELGNRNNLLAVPSAAEYAKLSASEDTEQRESAARNVANAVHEADQPDSQQILRVPELVIEKVDTEPRHVDSQAPAGRKDIHKMGADDAEPDRAITTSGTSTPAYAANAAEVADTAAALDREASPIPLSDEEAGRTGVKRLSSTPIPEVALTAAEVADIAAMLDQDDPHDEMMTSLPHLDLDTNTPSGRTTPSDERVPLFSHECLHSPDYEDHESPAILKRCEDDSSSGQVTEEETIDYDDPTLEKFPTDRMAVLEQIRSIESRLSVDEVRDDGSRSPVVVSPGLWSPSSTGLDPKTTPPLEVMSEEASLPDKSFAKLPSPVIDVDSKISPQLEVIPEEFQGPEISHSKLSDPVNNLEQLDNANTTTDSIAKSMPTLMLKGDQQEGLHEEQEPTLMKDLPESKDHAQLEELLDVHEPKKIAEEPLIAKETPEPQKLAEVGQPTSNGVQEKADDPLMAGPLLQHEKLLEAEEPNGTADLPMVEESTLVEKPILTDIHPKLEEPSIPGPFLQHKLSTEANESTSVEESETQPEGIKILATESGLVNLTTLEDRQTVIGVSSITETEGASKVDEPNAGVLDQSKAIKPATDSLLEETSHDEPKEIVQSEGHRELKEETQSKDVERSHEVDELGDSQKRAEVSKAENSHLGSSEINGMKIIEEPLVKQATGSQAEEFLVAAAPEAELQHVEQNVAPKDAATHIISLTPIVDPLAATGSASPESARHSSSGEMLAAAPAVVDKRDQTPVPIVENPPLVIKEEDPISATEENDVRGVAEGTPESLIDENTLAAAGGEDLLVNVPDEATPAIVREDHLLAAGADFGASKLAAEDDLSTTTPVENGQNISAEGEIPAVTVDNNSPPFLVHAAQTDPFESEEVTLGHTNGIDTAKSTSLEEPLINNSNDSDLKTRISSTVERPVTPASIHSALNGKESSNFFKALWRSVFVGWIGGLFRRIFGGGSSSVFTVCALLLLGGWYFSAAA